MKQKSKIIFISWCNFHPHTQQLGTALKAEIFYIKNFIQSRGLIWKFFFFIDYLIKSLHTLQIIIKSNPDVVIVQNPPSFAPVVVVLMNYFRKFKTISDTHNAAFEKPWISLPLHKWALKQMDLVIVHNNQLYEEVKSNHKLSGVNFKVLNSRLTDFSRIDKEIQKEPYFLVISTFHADEPMDALLEGIRLYCSNNDTKIKFKITGNYEKKPHLYSEYSKDKNIEFLGFIDQQKYYYLLVNAYGVISLSTRDKVQQFSIMEAVSAEVPFISTDNLTNRDLFKDKMVLTENKPFNIKSAIMDFIHKIKTLQINISEIKSEISSNWKSCFQNIKKEMKI